MNAGQETKRKASRCGRVHLQQVLRGDCVSSHALTYIKEEASLKMNSAAPLYSCGSEILPIMFSFSHNSLSPGSSSKFLRTICHIRYSRNQRDTGPTQHTGVMMLPGQSTFTLIALPSMILPHSMARLRPSWITAALDELYTLAVKPLLAMSPLMDPISRIEPGHLYFTICRAQAVAER